MKSRSAHAVYFGLDFQVNAAIVLMLENIKDLQSLRLEGNDEDIELTLVSGKKILAQAKAIENSSSDFSHVRANLKKALESLSDGAQGAEVEKLILITNSPNPFNDNASRSVFWGPAHRDFSTLPQSARQIVEKYLANISNALDPQHFSVQVLPFETDNDTERYKCVLQVINDFIAQLHSPNLLGQGNQLHRIWKNDIFVNGSKKNTSICLNKKSIIWPIIVLETDISHCDEQFIDQFDTGVYEEVVHLYGSLIDNCCERIEFFTKVLYDYNQFNSTKKNMERAQDFANSTWKSYKSEFESGGIDGEVLEALTKIILYNVVRRRIAINKIKQEVGL